MEYGLWEKREGLPPEAIPVIKKAAAKVLARLRVKGIIARTIERFKKGEIWGGDELLGACTCYFWEDQEYFVMGKPIVKDHDFYEYSERDIERRESYRPSSGWGEINPWSLIKMRVPYYHEVIDEFGGHRPSWAHPYTLHFKGLFDEDYNPTDEDLLDLICWIGAVMITPGEDGDIVGNYYWKSTVKAQAEARRIETSVLAEEAKTNTVGPRGGAQMLDPSTPVPKTRLGLGARLARAIFGL